MKSIFRIESDRFFGMLSNTADEAIINMQQQPESFGPDDIVTLTEMRGDDSKVLYSGRARFLTVGPTHGESEKMDAIATYTRATKDRI